MLRVFSSFMSNDDTEINCLLFTHLQTMWVIFWTTLLEKKIQIENLTFFTYFPNVLDAISFETTERQLGVWKCVHITHIILFGWKYNDIPIK